MHSSVANVVGYGNYNDDMTLIYFVVIQQLTRHNLLLECIHNGAACGCMASITTIIFGSSTELLDIKLS